MQGHWPIVWGGRGLEPNNADRRLTVVVYVYCHAQRRGREAVCLVLFSFGVFAKAKSNVKLVDFMLICDFNIKSPMPEYVLLYYSSALLNSHEFMSFT